MNYWRLEHANGSYEAAEGATALDAFLRAAKESFLDGEQSWEMFCEGLPMRIGDESFGGDIVDEHIDAWRVQATIGD